jgi:hypothetical protein
LAKFGVRRLDGAFGYNQLDEEKGAVWKAGFYSSATKKSAVEPAHFKEI